jgi:ribosomal protein S18 acetylase RimI-like enzyme
MATEVQIGEEFLLESTSPEFERIPLNSTVERLLLGTGFKLRAARWSDLEPVTQLILDVCTNDGDPTVAVSTEELKSQWEAPGFNLETDAWVVTTTDGRVVGYEEFVNRYAHASLGGDGYVHPGFMGHGIGTAMLRVLEERARKEIELADPEHRVFIRNAMSIGDTVSRQMHENEGYKAIRFYWRMEITLEGAPPVPIWPEGIELRPFDVDAHAYLVYRAHEEAFQDHWGHTPHSFEEWRHRTLESSDFDPSLWFIAWEADRIAGYALDRYRSDKGWVGTLGVRRLWRRRGLGLALLYHSFGEFFKLGSRVISLGVDASNPTGATRLYQKAGMHVASEFVSYEKELRPGREPEVES